MTERINWGEGINPMPQPPKRERRVEKITQLPPNRKQNPDTMEITEAARELLEQSQRPTETDDESAPEPPAE